MSTIVLDAATIEALKQCHEPAVLRDSIGTVIGYFEPPEPIYNEGDLPQFDEAELDRREQQWQGIPSADVRKMLENLR
jgi:hypothetical protein